MVGLAHAPAGWPDRGRAFLRLPAPGAAVIPRLHCDDALLRKLWATDATVTEIGQRIGASRTWVSMRAKKLGLPARACSTGALPAAKIEHAYVTLGMTAEEIRDQLRAQFPTIAATTVRRVLRHRGITIRPGKVRTADAYVVECVRLRRAGWEHAAIAAKLGLTVSQVGHRCRRILGAGKRGARSKIDVATARHLRGRGMSWRAVAAELGVSVQGLWYAMRAQARAVAS